jgi:hypothetical protein
MEIATTLQQRQAVRLRPSATIVAEGVPKSNTTTILRSFYADAASTSLCCNIDTKG